MFDVSWSELLLVAIVAILVVGPKELPALLRSLGRMLGKLRSTADEFRKQFDEAVREAGAEDLQREMQALRKNNPLTQIRDSIDEAARDPFKPDPPKALPKSGKGADDEDLDDLAPPPPLPPRNATATTATTSAPSSAGSTPPQATTVANAPQPSVSPAKDAAEPAGGSEIRLNGEHRPQAN